MRVWPLIVLIGVAAQFALAHRWSLQTLRELWIKHSQPSFHDVGFLAALRIVPRFFFVPHDDPSITQAVVVPEAEDFHPSEGRIPRMMDGLDVVRLAKEWPDSVTPGGPGPEWW